MNTKSPENTCSTQKSWNGMASLTVLAAGVLSLGFALLMPPFGFNDEHGHFARAYQISRGEFIGRRNPRLPSAVLSDLLRYPERLERKATAPTRIADLFTAHAADFSASEPVGDNPQARRGYLSWDFLSYQVYWPVTYLPSGVGLRIARSFQMSTIGMLYVGRLMNVLCFCAALAAALALAPSFRALITAVALMPMTLLQCAAVAADQVTITLAFVGFALVLRTRERPVSRIYLAILLLVFPVWVLCKNSYWALPLLLLIPSRQFGGKLRRATYIASVIVITLSVVVAWGELTSDALAGFRAAAESTKGIDIYANAREFAGHPFQVLRDVTAGPAHAKPLFHLRMMMNQFVGVFGWQMHDLPIRFVYLFMLFGVAFLEFSPKEFAVTERILLLVVFAGGLLSTYFVLFVIAGMYQDGHYTFWAAGTQGRYVIPYCLAGLLALKQSWFRVSSRVLAPAVLSAATLYGLWSLGTVANYYYK